MELSFSINIYHYDLKDDLKDNLKSFCLSKKMKYLYFLAFR